MQFETYIAQQLDKHPSAMPQDIVKLCFQAAYGAEHVISDLAAARDRFENEYAAARPQDTDLYEAISADICRVNLAAWKHKGLPGEWLFRMFAASASVQNGNDGLFLSYLETAETVLKQHPTGFSSADWQTYLAAYRKSGMPAVHHSAPYRENEAPSYRIVHSRYCRLFPLLEQTAKQLRKDKVCVIAIDGRAASGKSTMAEQLKQLLDAAVIQMDDFFLPVALRTEERLRTPGGNVHYERFIEEVLPYVSLPQRFSYRRFDCGSMDYNGSRVVENTPLRIVEGSYSCHPLFGKYADITVFLDVDPAEQLRRIQHRNGKEMAAIFQSKWIPLEEAYFENAGISQKADIRLTDKE